MLLLVLLGAQFRGFCVSKFPRSRIFCGLKDFATHCVWVSHTIPHHFKPDVLVKALGEDWFLAGSASSTIGPSLMRKLELEQGNGGHSGWLGEQELGSHEFEKMGSGQSD